MNVVINKKARSALSTSMQHLHNSYKRSDFLMKDILFIFNQNSNTTGYTAKDKAALLFLKSEYKKK